VNLVEKNINVQKLLNFKMV